LVFFVQVHRDARSKKKPQKIRRFISFFSVYKSAMYNGVTVRSEINFLCPYLSLHENAMRTNVEVLGICLRWERQFHALPVWK